MGLRSDCS